MLAASLQVQRGGTGPTQCWRCAPITVPCFTHPKYPRSLHRSRGLPVNLGQAHERPLGANFSGTFAPLSPREVFWAVPSMGADSGSSLDGKSPQQSWVTQSRPPWVGKESCSQVLEKKRKNPKGQTPLHPGSGLCRCFSWFHFPNNQPLIIKPELLGKWS